MKSITIVCITLILFGCKPNNSVIIIPIPKDTTVIIHNPKDSIIINDTVDIINHFPLPVIEKHSK